MPTAKPTFDIARCDCGATILWGVTGGAAPVAMNNTTSRVFRWTGEGHNVEEIKVFTKHQCEGRRNQ